MDTSFLSVIQLALIPLVVGVISIVKTTPLTGTTNRFAPLWSLGLGVGAAFLVPSATLQLTILAGIVIGISAAGVYSGVKTVTLG